MLIALTLLLAAPVMAGDPPEKLDSRVARYELGLRLRALEGAWEVAEAPAKTRALPALLEAVETFFRFRMAEAAADMDGACLDLVGEGAEGSARWAASLALVPESRLVEPVPAEEEGGLGLELRTMYAPPAARPEGATALVRLLGEGGETLVSSGPHPIPEPPALSLSLPLAGLPAGDHRLVMELDVDGARLRQVEQGLSIVPDAAARLERLRGRLDEGAPRSLERETAERLVGLVGELAAGKTLECDHPAAWMLTEAEHLLDRGEERLLDAERSGLFRLRVPLERGHLDARLAVPPLEGEEPRPLVVLMHGAGGSDNLFFEGYGQGLAVRLALERGWVAVAPRAPLFGQVDVAGLVDALADRYRIDRSAVLLVGHSMGAAQALAAARAEPELYRGLAAIGGGRPSSSDGALAGVPVLVATGTEDFARPGAEALVGSLEQAGVAVTYDLRPEIEHLMIVQECLPEVFGFLEGLVGEAGQRQR